MRSAIEFERASNISEDLKIIDCEVVEYKKALQMQEYLRELRKGDNIPDTVLLLEHPHVYTLGTDVKEGELPSLIKDKINEEIVATGRGGKITYHGPGQLVGYFIWKIPLKKLGKFLNQIEQTMVSALQTFGIDAYSRKREEDVRLKGIRGAWIMREGIPKKIASQALEMTHAPKREEEDMVVSMHGFALNVNTDKRYFAKINPCGFEYNVMTSMQEILGREIDMLAVKREIIKQLKERREW